VKVLEKPNSNPFVGEEYDEDAEEEAEELRLAEVIDVVVYCLRFF